MVFEQSSRVAIYARFSSDKQSDASIEDQVHRASEWVRSQGGNPAAAEVFSDFAVSGASMDRPGAQALLKAVQAGTVDLVIAESLDRLSRRVSDLARFRETLSHHRVQLLCLDGTQLSKGKSDALLFGVRSIFAEQYLSDLADKTLRGLEGRARAGKATGGAPFGYRNVKSEAGSTVEIDPRTAPIVRRIFALYIAGTSLANIAGLLNSEGVPSPRAHSRRIGQGWMHTAVRAILVNERYRGVWTFGQREWVKEPGTNTRRPRVREGGPLHRLDRPDLALVDAQTWEAAQARFTRHPVMPAKKRTLMLSGLLLCSACGGRMQYSGGSSKPYYACSNAQKRRTCENRRCAPVAEVEAAVLDTIRTRLTECMDDVRDLAEEEIKTWATARPGRRATAVKELSEVERMVGNVVGLVIETGSEALKAKLRELEARKTALRAELVTLELAAPVLPSAAEIADRVHSLGVLAQVPPNEAREALRKVIEGAQIHCEANADRSFTLRWGILPGPFLAPDAEKPPTGIPGGGHWTTVVAGAGFVGGPIVLPCEARVR